MKKAELTIEKLYDLSHTIAEPLFKEYTYPWEVLPHIGEYIKKLGSTLSDEEYNHIDEYIWVHKSVTIPKTASLTGPLIICEGAEVRQCAFFRGNVIVGENAVAGNSCEFKNSILFDNVQTPHYNYVGDSILGYKSHMGASSLTSNVKSDKKLVVIHAEDGEIETGLKKVGAMLGDSVEVGCGSVLNPGAVIGKNSNIYPLSSVRGCVPCDSIFKAQDNIVLKSN